MVAQEASDGIARLSAFTDPILHAVVLQRDGRGLLQRVVRPDDLDEPAIPGAGLFGDHHAVEWVLLLANTGKANR